MQDIEFLGTFDPINTQCCTGPIMTHPVSRGKSSQPVVIFVVYFQEVEGKETALLIDRYRYYDLLPCSTTELKSLGYKV